MLLPEHVREVTIACDNDRPGIRAAVSAASRWRRDGRAVQILGPEAPGSDFNDCVRA